MMGGVTTTDPTSQEQFSAMWRRQQPAWHAAMGFVWAAAVVVTLVDEPGPDGRTPSLVLFGVMALAYLVLGLRAMAHEHVRYAVGYHLVAWGALLSIQWVDPGTQSWLLFFALFPQLWAMLPARWATVATFVVVLAFSLVRWAQLDFDPDNATEILISANDLDRAVAVAGPVHQPDHRRGREPRHDDRRAARGPAAARRRRARPRRPRGAGAPVARDPRHPRPGVHLGRRAVAGGRRGPGQG